MQGPKGTRGGFMGLSSLRYPRHTHELRCQTTIDGPSEEVLHGQTIGWVLTGHPPQGGEVNGLPSLGRLTHALPSAGGGEDSMPRLCEVGRYRG